MSYLSSDIVKWHSADIGGRQYCVIEDGKKIALPRYYKQKLYSAEQLGYLKGYNERKRLELNEELIRKNEIPKARDLMEAVKAGVRRMNNSPVKTKI